MRSNPFIKLDESGWLFIMLLLWPLGVPVMTCLPWRTNRRGRTSHHLPIPIHSHMFRRCWWEGWTHIWNGESMEKHTRFLKMPGFFAFWILPESLNICAFCLKFSAAKGITSLRSVAQTEEAPVTLRRKLTQKKPCSIFPSKREHTSYIWYCSIVVY